MQTFEESPQLVVRGQRFAGGWLIYMGAALCAGGLLSIGSERDIALALAGIALGGALLGYCAGLWRQEVRIFASGFVWRRFGRIDRVRWGEVQSHKLVYLRRPTGTGSELRIELRDGREHVLMHLADPEDLRRYLNTFCKGANP